MWGWVRRGVVSSKSPSSFLLLLPPALKKVPGPWRRDTPLPWLHCGRCTRCCLIVTRWTLTAQPALTMCLLDTAACGTSTPSESPGPLSTTVWEVGAPAGRWGHLYRGRWGGRVAVRRRRGGWRPNQATKRHCLFGHWLKKEKESLLSGAKRIRMRGVWTDGEVREGKDRTGEKPHSASRRRWS